MSAELSPKLDVESPAALESEIRRLKYELMRRQLDEKLISLKSYIERQQHMTNATIANTTTTNATSNDYDDDDEDVNQIFSSVLFANVFGDFEVWHFVLAILFLWLIAMFMINYVRHKISVHRARAQHKLKRQMLMDRARISTRPANNYIVHTNLVCDTSEATSSSVNDDVDAQTSNAVAAPTAAATSTQPDTSFVDFEFVSMPKRDFFLYSIQEHELTTKKKFRLKQKQPGTSGANTNLVNLSGLSKSEPTLT